MDFQEYRIAREGRRDLVFLGVLLGHASSRHDNAPRWFEVSIYLTERGRYVICGVGRTILPGETDRGWTSTLDTPDAVIRGLLRRDHTGAHYMTRTASMALAQAAQVDNAFAEAMVAWAV